MEESQSASFVLVIMKNLNLIIILYIAVLMTYSLSGYIQENSALDFLEGIYSIPIVAWKIPILSIGLYCCCMLLLYIQNESSWGLFLKICIELAISFCISYVIGFSYIGIVLLVLADTVRYFPKSEWKWKFSFVIIICMLYLLIDYNLLLLYFKITPLETYLEYFQSDIRSILLGIKNMLNSLNMLIFIVYIILLMHIQLSEKERILSLNEELNALNEELRQANIQLEKYAKEAEQASKNKERNRLAMEIHDALGHALTGIITGIEACATLMDIAPEATKEQLKAIAEVARQGMTDVRRSIKALRPDALEKMNLDEALAQMIGEMRCATNAEILYQCNTELNCFNEEEENTIYRIIQECITNSIRHGKAKQIQIDIDRKCGMLEICIKDNGIGCSDIQEGFGLYHMEERLNRLQGNLRYYSEKGFVVEAEVPIRLGYGEITMIKVLIADDQELIRQSLLIILRTKPGFKVTDAVKNGLEVIQSIRKEKPDVILMDIRMPKMDGVACTQIIKENYPDIKIIILTTFDDDEYVFNALKYGASGYLLKGISIDELTGAISKVYQGTAMINEDIASKVVKLFSKMAQANIAIQIDEKQTAELKNTEWKIISLVGRGLSNKEIAQKLKLSEGTVRNGLSNILSKLNLRDRTQVAIWAVQTNTVNKVFEDEM